MRNFRFIVGLCTKREAKKRIFSCNCSSRWDIWIGALESIRLFSMQYKAYNMGNLSFFDFPSRTVHSSVNMIALRSSQESNWIDADLTLWTVILSLFWLSLPWRFCVYYTFTIRSLSDHNSENKARQRERMVAAMNHNNRSETFMWKKLIWEGKRKEKTIPLTISVKIINKFCCESIHYESIFSICSTRSILLRGIVHIDPDIRYHGKHIQYSVARVENKLQS